MYARSPRLHQWIPSSAPVYRARPLHPLSRLSRVGHHRQSSKPSPISHTRPRSSRVGRLWGVTFAGRVAPKLLAHLPARPQSARAAPGLTRQALTRAIARRLRPTPGPARCSVEWIRPKRGDAECTPDAAWCWASPAAWCWASPAAWCWASPAAWCWASPAAWCWASSAAWCWASSAKPRIARHGPPTQRRLGSRTAVRPRAAPRERMALSSRDTRQRKTPATHTGARQRHTRRRASWSEMAPSVKPPGPRHARTNSSPARILTRAKAAHQPRGDREPPQHA
jgi:hypothetical protein